MVEGPIHTLPGRGVVALSGLNARAWLDNLVSTDLTVLDASPVVFSALLSPQGKVLFEFVVFKSGDVLLLDVAADMLDGFTKRLKLYKLRAKLELVDVSADWSVVWGVGTASAGVAGGIVASDPRQGGLWRGL